MTKASLHAFVAQTLRSKCISFDDVKRLQRDILPDGVSSREEAELLLTLDREVSQCDHSFAGWLIPTLVDFVVWGERPTGTVDAATARWLAPLLSYDPTRVAGLLIDEIVREAQSVDDALLSLLTSSPKRRLRTMGFQDEPVRLAA